MRNRLEILVSGRSREELDSLEAVLKQQDDVSVTLRNVVNGHADPLHDVHPLPDALVLVVSENWQAELSALTERPASERPPLLVVGQKGNEDLIRFAMRAGARDFFTPPVSGDEIAQFLRELMRDKLAESSRHRARLTAVVNAKGGSGASMIAANLAHGIVVSRQRRVGLMDLDVQFGAMPLYFNLTPRNGLVRALELAETLDALALEGYVEAHSSGLELMASGSEDLLSIAEVPESRVDLLLQVMGHAYDDLVVDLPRWIGGASAVVLDCADRILLVVQQSVAHLRDAKRLMRILRQELHIGSARVTVVVNRYDRRNAVGLRDIQEAFPHQELATVSNDFRRVTHSINVGSPLLEHAPRAPVTRDLMKLSRYVSDDASAESRKPVRWSLFNWRRPA